MLEIGGIFHQVALLLLLTAGIGLIATLLRQPLVVAFILAGIVAGPVGLGLVDPEGEIELFAEIGVAVLLFVVGLKLDVRMVRNVGPVALATGLGQVAFTSGVGWLLTLALGFDPVAALYIAVALTFSSTIIIVKLITDKGDLDSLYGRIAIGFLIVQDICVVIALIVLTAIGEPGGPDPAQEALRTVLTAVAFLAAIYLLGRYVLPLFEHRLARSPELMVLFAIAWAVALAAAADVLGFSEEVGAFLAGVSLASSPYRDTLGSRLTNLRDFLLLFFFVALGAQLDFEAAGALLVEALVLSAFVLIGNPIIVMVIMGAMGYRTAVSFRAGLTVAQISEFSLILAALGADLGQISDDVVALITVVGLVTIGLSTYMITYADALYERLQPMLGVFERNQAHRGIEQDLDREVVQPDVAVLGTGRYGRQVVERLVARGWTPIVVDHDPEALRELEAEGVPIRYGEVTDSHLPDLLPMASLRWVISTVRDGEANLVLLAHLQEAGFAGLTAVAARQPNDVPLLRDAGATVVLRPFADAARSAVEILEDHEEPTRPHIEM